MTSIANIFTMQKALVKILLGSEPILMIFAAIFKTFGMQKDDNITFVS